MEPGVERNFARVSEIFCSIGPSHIALRSSLNLKLNPPLAKFRAMHSPPFTPASSFLTRSTMTAA